MNDFDCIKNSILCGVLSASDRALLEQIEMSGDEGGVIVHCPSLFSQQLIKKQYGGLIKECIKDCLGSDARIHFQQSADGEKAVDPRPVQMVIPQVARHDGLALNHSFTFEDFIVGKCNAFAYEAARAVAEESLSMHKPLYFYSDIGLGKSHIAHAIGNKVIDLGGKRRLCYTTARDFSQDYVHAVMNNSLKGFKSRYTSTVADIFFMDDVHLLQKKEKTQMELCCILDDLMSAGKQVVLSGYRPPTSIPQIDKGLQSRFASGLVIDIRKPDGETKRKIVRHKAARNGIDLPDEVVSYICDNIHSNVRELESAVLSITAMSSLMRRKVDLNLAMEILEGKIQKSRTMDITYIQDFVAKNFEISRDEMVSPCRRKEIAYPRQIAIYLCREYTDETLQRIATAFGRRHTSIMHALEVIKNQYDNNLKTRKEIDFLIEKMDVSK